MSKDRFLEDGLPSNVGAERSILGAILLENSVSNQAQALLKREHFFLDSHRRIFEKMCALSDCGTPIDLVTLEEELRRAGEFEQVGGAVYIASLIDGVPRTDNIEPYAKIVREKADQRRILVVAQSVTSRILDGDLDFEKASGYVEQELDQIRQESESARSSGDIRDRIITADELMALEFPEPRWAVEGIIQEGAVILAGRPKLGKSYLALNISVAVASGGYALGKIRVEHGEVLHLALEDGLRRFQFRLGSIYRSGSPLPNLHVKTRWKRLDEGGSRALDHWLSAHPDARLVVIDTFKKVRPLPHRGAGIYDEDYDGMAMLVDIADRFGVSILVVHHTNKKLDLDDPLDLVSGSTGLTGAADSVLVLKRERGRHDATLFITGRDVEERELSLEIDSQIGTWRLLGEAENFRRSEERERIIQVLKDAAGSLLGPKQIAGKTGQDHGNVRQLLRRMLADGEVRNENGKYGLPHHTHHIDHTHHSSELFSDGVMGGGEDPSHLTTAPSNSAIKRNGEAVMGVIDVIDEKQSPAKTDPVTVCCSGCGTAGLCYTHCERCGEFLRNGTDRGKN